MSGNLGNFCPRHAALTACVSQAIALSASVVRCPFAIAGCRRTYVTVFSKSAGLQGRGAPMKNDTDLVSLRDREDLKQLVAKLERVQLKP